MAVLEISVEGCWRGSILDTVKPICKLSLEKSSPGIYSLDPYYSLKLENGGELDVGCSWCNDERSGLLISKNGKNIFHARTRGEFYIEITLSDGLQYQFKLDGSKNDT